MIILTGAAGFIGSCFLRKLNSEGISDLIIVDHLGNDNKWRNLTGKEINLYYHKKDFRKALKRGEINPKEIDYIIHLGACSSTTERDADFIMDNNLSYSVELANFALANDISFMYASSAATYGDGSDGYSDYEFDHIKPLNPYGLSKHLFDKWIINNKYDGRVVGLKYFNVFGPNEYHKGGMASMVLKAFQQIREKGEIELFKSNTPEFPDGGQMRDFIYIKDVIEVMWQIFKKGKNINGIFNLGTGKTHSWNELATAVFEALDKPVNIKYIDMPTPLTKQYQNYTKADMEKMKKAGIDYNFTEFKDSIFDYTNGYLQQDYKIY